MSPLPIRGNPDTSLIGTPYQYIYHLLLAPNDIELINRMSLIFLVYTIVTAIWSIFNPAPYGRYSKTIGGFNSKIAWMVQESPCWMIPILLMLQTPVVQLKNNPVNLIALCLFMVHYVQRSLVFPFRMSANAKPTPLVIIVNAYIFCMFNGFYQSHHLLNVHDPGQVSSIVTLLGIGLFLTGMMINMKHDGILLRLKEKSSSSSKAKTGGYQIPRGQLFEYVTGANYFGEIIEWWAYYLLTNGTPQLLFAIFSTLFLGLRAWHHHKFYLKKFGGNYPKNRKIIIPFIL